MIVLSPVTKTAATVGLLALLTLTACSSTPPADPGGSTVPDETTAPVAEPVVDCPDGFVDAYAASTAPTFTEPPTITEATAAEFQPAFLAPFLDGGCAVHVVGEQDFGGGVIPVDAYVGFSPDASIEDALIDAFEANGYTADADFPGNFRNDADGRFGMVLLVSGDTQSNGWDAVTASFPDGVVFSG